jgi:hypothetical protein
MNDIVGMDRILALQSAMLQMPQAEGLVTNHYFANGMYARELHRPLGTLIVGKIHKHEHFFIVTKGEIIAWTEQGMKRMPAPSVHVTLPGTKRVTIAVVDSTAMTVHRTALTDLDDIEAEIIEAEDGLLFDASNALKDLKGELACLGSQ